MSPLNCHRCCDGIARSSEGEKECVPLCIDLTAVVRAEGVADYAAMLCDQVTVVLGELLQQRG
jgi:hypothetical protein